MEMIENLYFPIIIFPNRALDVDALSFWYFLYVKKAWKSKSFSEQLKLKQQN